MGEEYGIPVNGGRYTAIVDEEDFYRIGKYWWALQVEGYAHRHRRGMQNILMHREILDAGEGDIVEHINGNGLDNRRSNLRLSTRSRIVFKDGKRNYEEPKTSEYKGVCYCKQTGRWKSTIRVDGKQKWLGRHNTEEAAARAYDEAAKELIGEHAFLNFPGLYI